MKSDIIFKLLYLFTALIVIVNLVFAVKNGIFFDINELPEGEMLGSVESPNGDKTLNIYLVDNKLGVAVRGEIDDGKRVYNVFWQTDTDNVDYSWLDNNVVTINQLNLDIRNSTYDSRRGTSLFQDGAVEGKAAEDFKNRNFFME